MQIIDIKNFFPENEINDDDLGKMFPDWDKNKFI